MSNFAALVIPGYYSLQALETTTTADDTQFLTYWVVYAVFSVIEFWSKTILYYIPFYWVFKTIFFLYIGLPQFGGSKYLYVNFIRPFSVKVLGITGAPVPTPKTTTTSEPVAPSTTSANLKEKIDIATEDVGSTTGASLHI